MSAAVYLKRVIDELAADRVAYALLIAYSAVALLYVVVVGRFDAATTRDMLIVYLEVSLLGYGLIFPMLLVIATTAHIVLRLPQRRRLAWRLAFQPRNVARLLAGTALMMAMIPFRAIFNLAKLTIPEPSGFAYDLFFADLDKAMHFGVDPFRYLHALGADALLLRIIELNYNNLWFLITFGALYIVAVSRRFDAIRLRFVICFLMAWAVAGTIVAILGSSAGPAYYGAVTGDTARFADLIQVVGLTQGQPGSAADFQRYLWDAYSQSTFGLGTGISAFPSVHVTIIAMLACFVTEHRNRWFAVAAWGYVAVTVMCSVYLGWHYAVDGYAGIALAIVTHLAVRKLATARFRWSATPAPVEARPAT